MTTKIVALTDAHSNLAGFELLPGQRHDTLGVAPLIDGLDFAGLIADKAFDVNWIVEDLERRGAEIVISQHGLPPLNGSTYRVGLAEKEDPHRRSDTRPKRSLRSCAR